MKRTEKYILDRRNYKLDVAGKCVRIFFQKELLDIANVALITNITTNNVLYNPHCDGMGGTISNNVIIFENGITADMTDDDDLMIIIQENVSYIGEDSDRLKTEDTNSHLLEEILIELKINNKHLELITEVSFEDDNTDI